MSEDTATKPKSSRWRRIFWMLAGALLLTMIGKGLLPDLAGIGQERIALVRIQGPILDSHTTVSELQKYGEDPLVKAIVIRIDSPGGGVAPSQEIYNAVKRVRKDNHKTIVTSMGTVAASGGYYIAVASDRILANPGTLTGSIGVIMQLANFEDLMEKIGVRNTVIKSGRYKDVGSPFRTMSDDERQYLQTVMDDAHRQFIEAVADGRSLDVADVEILADGRIFTGQQAKDVLLVDELGDLHQAIKLAADMSGMKEHPYVVETQKPFSLQEFLGNRFLGEAVGLPIKTGLNLMYFMAL
ncbi:MAG: signal peptide peptidase SppA [Nitrospirae bacterium]|nr:signal peptide peptidase SppA [Nitrospirota bacterium]MDA1304573.1 signal peptide peptidase SppA [Nitrospirota bacterium]